MRKASNIAACILAATFLLFAVFQPVLATQGQWSSSGSTIYYNYSGGKVGIGISSPSDPLQVLNPNPTDPDRATEGKVYIGADAGSWWFLGVKLTNGDGANNITSNAYVSYATGWQRRTAGYEGWVMSNYITSNNQGYFKIFHIDPEAGTSISPGKMKPVFSIASDGTTYLRALVLNNTWADYVFDPNYELMPLADVANYIQQNKHLPGVQTAAEVGENGMSVGDTLKTQMQKIEELTLYVIQQQKEINDLKISVTRLEYCE